MNWKRDHEGAWSAFDIRNEHGEPIGIMKTQKQMAGKVKPRRCLGFGDKEGKCDKVAGTTRTPYWCQECDDARCGHITARLEAMIDRMNTVNK
jgi:hypothetical protein